LSSDVQSGSLEPVHSVVIESRQTKRPIWRVVGDRKQVCDRLFAPLLRICSLPRPPSPICSLLSGTGQRQNVGGLVWPR